MGARYLLVLFGVYPVMRLAGALLVAALCLRADLPSGGRIPDLRLLPEATQEAALRSLFASAARTRGESPWVLVTGDSQVLGHTLEAAETFSGELARRLPEFAVLNAAKMGTDFRWVRAVLEAALADGRAPRALVFNANPQKKTPRAPEPQLAPGSLVLSLVASNETLAAVPALLRGDFYFRHPVRQAPGQFHRVALPADFFPARLPAQDESELRAILARTAGTVPRVVVILAPHETAPYAGPPYAYAWNTEPVVARLREICQSFAHATCLDAARSFDRRYFHDVVHLEAAAHRILGREVARVLRAGATGLATLSVEP